MADPSDEPHNGPPPAVDEAGADSFVVGDLVVTTQRDRSIDWLPSREGCWWSASGTVVEVRRGPGARCTYSVRCGVDVADYAASELRLSTEVWARAAEYWIDPRFVVLNSRREGLP